MSATSKSPQAGRWGRDPGGLGSAISALLQSSSVPVNRANDSQEAAAIGKACAVTVWSQVDEPLHGHSPSLQCRFASMC